MSCPDSVTSYAARGAPDGMGTATLRTSNGPSGAVARPASCRAIRNASAGDSVAGSGARASRVSEEVTRTTLPWSTSTAASPSWPAGRSPYRWRSRTTEPVPIGRTARTSSVPVPNSSPLRERYARAAVTGSAGRPVAAAVRGGLYAAGVPNSSILDNKNSVVSMPAIPLRTAISLKQPTGVPSADAPLSPMM